MQFLTEKEPARGEMLPVLPAITRIVAPNPGPMTYWGTNTYLVEAEGGTLIVDPGPDDKAHVEAVLHATAGSRVEAILVTHSHHDHIGALPALRAATAAPVVAFHAPADAAVRPDIGLQDGDRVGQWQAIATPGHAPDHLCFIGPGRVMLSGDHVMGWSSTVVGPPPSGDMSAYFRSLERLCATEASVFLPGHGPKLEQPGDFVDALLAHRHARESAIVAALGPAPAMVTALTGLVYGAIDPGLRRAAERNVLAHLHKLREEGRAEETVYGWRATALT